MLNDIAVVQCTWLLLNNASLGCCTQCTITCSVHDCSVQSSCKKAVFHGCCTHIAVEPYVSRTVCQGCCTVHIDAVHWCLRQLLYNVNNIQCTVFTWCPQFMYNKGHVSWSLWSLSELTTKNGLQSIGTELNVYIHFIVIKTYLKLQWF